MYDLKIIKDYIDSENIGMAERRFLIDYMANVISTDADIIPISYSDVISDVKRLNDYLRTVDDTSLVRERIDSELDILNYLASAVDCHKELVEASYRLDQLYYESDMPFRNTDTVFRKVMQNKASRGK